MTEKELGKLKRPDLLALLVEQGRETVALQEQLDETEQRLAQAVQLDNRLRSKLDEKDEQIERLKQRLNEKDAQLAKLTQRLNEKDEQLERLKGRLNEKDQRIALLDAQAEELVSGRFLTIDGAYSLTDISVKVELLLRAAQKAANSYLREAQKKGVQKTV